MQELFKMDLKLYMVQGSIWVAWIVQPLKKDSVQDMQPGLDWEGERWRGNSHFLECLALSQ